MTRCLFSVLLLQLVHFCSLSVSAEEQLPDGEELARSIRDALPTEDTILDATMEVTLRDRSRIKTSMKIQAKRLGQGQCLMTYETKPEKGVGHHWSVLRTVDKRNEYVIGEQAKRVAKLADLHSGLAKSSFTLADFGLEFLHWPNQRTIKKQRRKSRACHVLESTRPSADGGGYLRVLSWVDIKSGGILAAEFFLAKGKAKRRFSVKGLTKKDGQWLVDEMEMVHLEQRSRSRLRFHLK